MSRTKPDASGRAVRGTDRYVAPRGTWHRSVPRTVSANVPDEAGRKWTRGTWHRSVRGTARYVAPIGATYRERGCPGRSRTQADARYVAPIGTWHRAVRGTDRCHVP